MLAGIDLRLGDPAAAIQALRQCIELHPDSVIERRFLAWILATHPDDHIRDGAEAVRLAEHVCHTMQALDGVSLGTLAGAYAEVGEFEKAVKAQRRSIKYCEQRGDPGNADAAKRQLEYYESGRPFRMSVESILAGEDEPQLADQNSS